MLGLGLGQAGGGGLGPGRRGPPARNLESRPRDAARTPATPARSRDDLQLVDTLRDGCRSHATNKRRMPLVPKPFRELAGERRLTGALQACQHDHGRWGLRERQLAVSPPRMVISSSLTILTTCWAGLSAPETSAPLARSLMRATNARTTCSETSASSSGPAESRGWSRRYRRRSAAPLPTKPLQGAGQPVGQRFKHADQPNLLRKPTSRAAGAGSTPYRSCSKLIAHRTDDRSRRSG